LEAAKQHQLERRHQMPKSWPDPNKYNPRSLGFLHLDNSLRKLCILGIEWKWWDRIVLGVILLNTIQLAIYDPFDIEDFRPVSPRREALDYLSKVSAAVCSTVKSHFVSSFATEATSI
jgi:hypothetical protein